MPSRTGARARSARPERVHARSAMSLTNVAYNASFGWADPTLRTLEAQMAVPMFNEHPIELGLKGRESRSRGAVRLASGGQDRASFTRRFPAMPSPSDAPEYRQGDRGVRADARVRATRRSIAISIATTRARCPRRRLARHEGVLLEAAALRQNATARSTCRGRWISTAPRKRARADARVSQHGALRRRRPRRVSSNRSRALRHHRSGRPTWAASARRRCAISP